VLQCGHRECSPVEGKGLDVINRIKGEMAIWFARKFDRTYSIDTFGQQSVAQSQITSSSKKYGQGFGSIPAGSLRALMRRLPMRPKDFVFIDYGCGKGRALFIAAEHSFKAAIGIEYASDLASIAKRNIELTMGIFQTPIQCLEMDAMDYEPPIDDECFFFLYSPFEGPVLERALDRISLSYERSPRELILCYARQSSKKSPDHKNQIRKNMRFSQIGKTYSPIDIGALPSIEFTLFKAIR
jgi:SAM-dependent methyltransferase